MLAPAGWHAEVPYIGPPCKAPQPLGYWGGGPGAPAVAHGGCLAPAGVPYGACAGLGAGPPRVMSQLPWCLRLLEPCARQAAREWQQSQRRPRVGLPKPQRRARALLGRARPLRKERQKRRPGSERERRQEWKSQMQCRPQEVLGQLVTGMPGPPPPPPAFMDGGRALLHPGGALLGAAGVAPGLAVGDYVKLFLTSAEGGHGVGLVQVSGVHPLVMGHG
eukprot:886446-Amphidinium_carterae.1